jgi:transposase
MDDRRLLLSDAAWARMATILSESKSAAGASPLLGDRDFVEAILYLARTCCPWRNRSERFGAWDAVYQRFRHWQRRSVWQALFARLPYELAKVETFFLDSTLVREHVHATGAAKKKAGNKRKPWVAAAAAGAPSCTSRPPTGGRFWRWS